MEHLFTAWPEVAPVLAQADHILLLSDYDGTLAPIVERPEFADLPQVTRLLLQELARQPRYAVGVISGRALSDLKLRVGVKGILYAGNHGLEIEAPAFSFVHPVAEEFKAVIHILSLVLERGLRTIMGAFVENKGLTLSVHYRLVEQVRVADVKSTFEDVVGVPRLLGRVRTTEGKKVYEVRPAVDWNKGKAVSTILANHRRTHPRSQPAIVFLGDDLTDEDGFKAVEKVGGISVGVGEELGTTAARYYLRSPGEVQELLGRLVDAERRRGQWTP